MRLLRNRRTPAPYVAPAQVRVPCADCGESEHPGVLNRLNGRLVCTRCYRVGIRARAGGIS